MSGTDEGTLVNCGEILHRSINFIAGLVHNLGGERSLSVITC